MGLGELCLESSSVGFFSIYLLGCGFKMLVPITSPPREKNHLFLLVLFKPGPFAALFPQLPYSLSTFSGPRMILLPFIISRWSNYLFFQPEELHKISLCRGKLCGGDTKRCWVSMGMMGHEECQVAGKGAGINRERGWRKQPRKGRV